MPSQSPSRLAGKTSLVLLERLAAWLLRNLLQVDADGVKQEFDTQNDQHRRDNDRARVGWYAATPGQEPVVAAEQGPAEEHRQPQQQIQGLHREVVNEVLQHQPPHKTFHQSRRELSQY